MLKSVLVVDDHEANRYYLKVLLESQGCEVGLACDGGEALQKARAQDFDLVVSDLLMPKMDGFSLLSRWIEDQKLRLVPFVVYTGTYTEPEDQQLALRLGAQAFLVKPMEPEDLLTELRKVLQNFNKSDLPMLSSEAEKSKAAEEHSEVLVRKLTNRNRELEYNQQRLLEEVREKQALLDALEARVAQLDENGVIIKVNKAWKEFAEQNNMTTPNWGVGLNYLDLAAFDTQDEDLNSSSLVEGIRGVLKGEHSSYFGDYPCHTEAKQSWFRLMVTSLNDAPNRGALVLHLDVTQQKIAENHLLRAQRLESIGTLAGGIAHDLNNTLGPILMAVDLLKSRHNDSATRELLASVESSAQRAGDLVRQVLMFARGAQSENKEVDVEELISEALKIVRETFPKNIQIFMSAQMQNATLVGDKTQLHQVFLNLCLNARDAMPFGGELKIKMREASPAESKPFFVKGANEGPILCLEVADTGTGVAPEHQQDIFEPFFTTKEVGKGTGLGLSTSLAIIKNHGGTVDVSSELGKGATFRVFLPVELKNKPKSQASRASQLPQGNGETILVVDDEVSIRSLTQRLLKMSGYNVLLAGSGTEALAVHKQERELITLVITDMMMPGMDGSTLIKKLHESQPDLKIIACSGLDLGGMDLSDEIKSTLKYLAKPFSAKELLTTVKETLIG